MSIPEPITYMKKNNYYHYYIGHWLKKSVIQMPSRKVQNLLYVIVQKMPLLKKVEALFNKGQRRASIPQLQFDMHCKLTIMDKEDPMYN